MKPMISFFAASLPLTIGLILSLTALSFLVSFTDYASWESIAETDFITFAVLALFGLPLTLFGINRLALKAAL